MSLPNKYEPKIQENIWRDFWDKEKIYKFDEKSTKPIFSVDTPPPYVSADHLHPGHIMSYSQAEFVVRFKRMQGFNVFYPMGFDDNGLPTERHIEKKYKINKNSISRPDFVKLCLEETQQGAKNYKELWELMGISVDWTKTYSTINPHSQKIDNFAPQGTVGEIPLLHRLRRTPHVHQNDGRAGVGHHFRHPPVKTHRADVIDDLRPFRQRLPGYHRLHRIDRKREIDPFGKLPDHRDHPSPLLFDGDRIGPGAGGLAPDVEDVRPLLRHPDPLFDGPFR